MTNTEKFKNLPAIPVAVSAHHVHLTQEAVEQLFGKGYQLKILKNLSQPGGWAAEETVDVIGPRGELKKLRILGPCREANQIEIAETESFKLGADTPVRISGDTMKTPEVTLVGPAGSIKTDGLIIAQRHIHMSPVDAKEFNLKHGDIVEVEIPSHPRSIVFRDVVIRVNHEFALEMHIDTDEANAAHIAHGGGGELMSTCCSAHITCCYSTNGHNHPEMEEHACCAHHTS